MNNFYVYAHINPSKNQIFYIGKGKGRRYKAKRLNGNKYWLNIVNKYGYTIDFLARNLTESEAFDLEFYWINKIGRKDLGLGPLVNHTDGGEGSSGYKFTKKQKQKLIKALKNRKPISNETKNKISKTLKGQILSEDRKLKISKTLSKGKSNTSNYFSSKRSNNEHWNKGTHTANSKHIIQYSLDGNHVAEYPSILEAKIQTNISHINRALLKGKPAGGYIWKYK